MRGRLKDVIKARRAQHVLSCSICLFMDDRPIDDAVTVINGHAVCDPHVYLVRDNELMGRVAFAIKKEQDESRA